MIFKLLQNPFIKARDCVEAKNLLHFHIRYIEKPSMWMIVCYQCCCFVFLLSTCLENWDILLFILFFLWFDFCWLLAWKAVSTRKIYFSRRHSYSSSTRNWTFLPEKREWIFRWKVHIHPLLHENMQEKVHIIHPFMHFFLYLLLLERSVC